MNGLTPVRIFFLAALLAAGTRASADPASEPAWLTQHVKELYAPYRNGKGPLRGPVHFVFGNDVWQPGLVFKPDSRWLALACDPKGCRFEEAVLAVKKEEWQGHYDDVPTQGQRLHFMHKGTDRAQVIVWFEPMPELPWLKPGPVVTYYSALQPPKRPPGAGTQDVLVELPDGDSAQFVPLAYSPSRLNIASEHRDAVMLQLRAHGKRQLLPGELGGCTGELPLGRYQYLQWAGDMEGDGKPDYLISYIDADGPVHLYFSSVAKANALVGIAGIYFSSPFGGECDGGGWYFTAE